MKKKSRKPNAYERQLRAEWEAILKQHSKPLERGASSKGLEAKPKSKRQLLTDAPSKVKVDPARDLTRHQSKVTGGQVTLGKRQQVAYTGVAMLGVGIMHKSNAVPIFSSEEAIEISTMRRN